MRPSLVAVNPTAAMGDAQVPQTAAVAGQTVTEETRFELSPTQNLSRERRDWVHAGPGPLSLVSVPNTISQYLGLDRKKKGTHSASFV